jgi:hypothetical protein
MSNAIAQLSSPQHSPGESTMQFFSSIVMVILGWIVWQDTKQS